MARKYLSPLNLLNLTTDPGTATEGDFYWNSSSNKLRIYFDGAWADAASTSSNYAYTNQANTFTTGPQTINTGAATTVGLILKGDASQTANLQEWYNTGNVLISWVRRDGLIAGQIQSPTIFKALIQPNSATEIPLTVKATASQTASLQEWQTSAGTVLTSIDSGGRILTSQNAGFGGRLTVGSQTVQGAARLVALAISATDIPFVARGFASQTADLQQWQDSGSSVLAKIDASGNITAASFIKSSGTSSQFLKADGSVDSSTYALNNQTFYLGTTSIAINRTSATQSLTGISIDGNAGTVTNGVYTNVANTFTTSPQQINGAASAIGLIIRANATAPGNLQEWQDSAGTLLAGITSAGRMYVTRTEGIQFIAGSGTLRSRIYSDVSNNIFMSGSNGSLFTFSTVGGLTISDTATSGAVKLVLKNTASQVADLQQNQNASNSVMGGLNYLSQIYTGPTPIYSQVGGTPTATSGDGTTATITLTSASNLAVGDLITVAGFTPSGYNATNVLITAVSNTAPYTVSYANATTGAMTVAGTVSAPAQSSITTRSAGTTGLIIKGTASQSAVLQAWQDSTGSSLSAVEAGGRITSTIGYYTSGKISIGGASWSGGSSMLNVWSTGTTSVPLTVRGTASQTGDLQQWQNSSGTTLAAISAGGSVYGTGVYASYLMQVTSGATTQVPMTVKGIASQSANLQEWQDSAGTILAKVGSTGDMTYGYGYISGLRDTAATGAYLNMQSANGILINTRSTTNPGLIIKATASQTANLQEWQDSSGNILTNITSIGGIETNGGLKFYTSSGRTAWSTLTNSSGDLSFNYKFTFTGGLQSNAANASTVGIIIKGASSQTADLTQWQDSTAAILAKVDKDGKATFAGMTLTGDLTVGGTTTTVNATTLNVADPMIYMGGGNTGDTVDLGFVSSYNDGTYQHSGLVRDASDGKWKLFKGVVPEPTTTVDFTSATYSTLKAGMIEGESFVPTGSTVPTNGIYLPSANTLAFATNSSANRIVIDSTGNIGIGNTPTTGFSLDVKKNITGSVNSYGIISIGQIQSDVTSSAIMIATYPSTQATTFTVNNIQHFRASQGTFGANSSVSTQYGYYLDNSLIGATTNYGFYGNMPSGTGRWNLYMAGAASNYIAGSTGIGTTSLTGSSLIVGKNITGDVFGTGIFSNGVVQSDVTTQARYFVTQASTAAATFTVPQLYHYVADQGTFGANSVVTNQYGFSVSSALTGATNNYAYYSALSAAANRYNIYMSGTAANYFAGQTAIGSAAYSMGNGGVAQMLGVTSSSATNIGAVIRGAASQTGDLTQWQSSAGTDLTSIDSGGSIRFNVNSVPMIKWGTATILEGVGSTASIRINPYGSTYIGLIVKGLASQTANLQEWQNNSGTAVGTMSASGAFTAITKSFDIPHPTKENMRLRYGSLEGPENGVYVRGRSKQNYIVLPDHWTGLVDEDSITVNITPVGKKQKIYVDKIENNKIYLGGNVKEYFFIVYGERKDVDKLTVEY